MASTFLAFLRYGKLFSLFFYVCVLAINVFYTIILKPEKMKTDEEKMRDYLITMHDYLWLLC